MTKEAIVGTLDGQPLRAEFPLRATVFGVEAVVLPETEYRRLQAIDAAATAPAPTLRQKSRSRFESDDEVVAFLMDRVGQVYASEALAECRARFGADRTPSSTSLSRLRVRLAKRAALGATRQVP